MLIDICSTFLMTTLFTILRLTISWQWRSTLMCKKQFSIACAEWNRAHRLASTQQNKVCGRVLTSCVCVLTSLPGDGETEYNQYCFILREWAPFRWGCFVLFALSRHLMEVCPLFPHRGWNSPWTMNYLWELSKSKYRWHLVFSRYTLMTTCALYRKIYDLLKGNMVDISSI